MNRGVAMETQALVGAYDMSLYPVAAELISFGNAHCRFHDNLDESGKRYTIYNRSNYKVNKPIQTTDMGALPLIVAVCSVLHMNATHCRPGNSCAPYRGFLYFLWWS